MEKQSKYLGIYQALIAQLDKLARHNRQGSYQTKDRYYEAMKRFCRYLAREYRIQKLANISGKHLVSYVLYLQASGKSASAVETELSAIRFFHDKMSNPKYSLPANSELGVELERRRFGGVDFPKVWHQKCQMCFTEADLLYTLNQLVTVLECRKGRLAETGCPNLDAYNEVTGENLPRLVSSATMLPPLFVLLRNNRLFSMLVIKYLQPFGEKPYLYSESAFQMFMP